MYHVTFSLFLMTHFFWFASKKEHPTILLNHRVLKGH